MEHRDRQGGQEEGALSFCTPGCSTSPGHGIPNTGTCSSPLSTLERCVCAGIRALMDEPKMGDRSLWGALHPSRWHRIPGGERRQQILGAAKAGKTHLWQGVWVSGRLAASSGSAAARNEPAPIPLPFGKDVTTAGASRLPEKHRSLHCRWFIWKEASFFTDRIRSTEWITAWSNLDS